MDWISIALALIGGLGLFLYGMKLISDGLEMAAGNRLRKWLEALTGNRFVGVLVGFGITAIIQSSSATTVMLVTFVNAGLMQLSQTVGVIMGANIGTTITGVLITLRISTIAPIAAFAGIAMMFTKKKNVQSIGQIIAGFGILFMGMGMMSEAMDPLSGSAEFMGVIMRARNPAIGLLVGTALTAVIQSSSAFTGVLIALAMAGVLDLRTAIFLLFGTSIGTCVTALLASVGANKMAKRTAFVHLFFNIIGAAIFTVVALLPLGFAEFIERIVPNDVPRQVAVALVVFKIATTVILFPFAKQLVYLVSKLIPGEDEKRADKRLEFLDSLSLATPAVAVAQARKEVERMARLALDNYRLAVSVFLERKPEFVEDALSNEDVINYLNHEITGYLIKISALNLEYHDRLMIGSLYHVVNDIERIGDHAENIVEFGQSYIDDVKIFSKDAVADMTSMSGNVDSILTHAIEVFSTGEYIQGEMDGIQQAEEAIDAEMELYKENHIERLEKSLCTQASGMLFVNMLSDLERVADHATNIAFSLRYQKK